MSSQVFKYEPVEEYLSNISSAKSVIPKWYRDAPKFVGDAAKFYPERTAALKLCVPFLDAMTSGYVVTLGGDLLVETVDGEPFVTWGAHQLVGTRESSYASTIPIPHEHSSLHLFWDTSVCFRLPKGYSALFTHPFNRFDLPFTTLTGVIDDYDMSQGNFPFFLKKGFEGVIPQGTPIIQILPFKRETWKSKREPGLKEKASLNISRRNAQLYGWYKNTAWKKKTYN